MPAAGAPIWPLGPAARVPFSWAQLLVPLLPAPLLLLAGPEFNSGRKDEDARARRAYWASRGGRELVRWRRRAAANL